MGLGLSSTGAAITSGTRYRVGDKSYGYFRCGLKPQPPKHEYQHELEQAVKRCWHGFGVEHAFAVLATGLFRVLEVLLDRY